MALYIKIEKILEKDGIGYYHVSTENYGGADFYVGIDKRLQKIICYLTSDFSNPIRIVDLNDPEERIGSLPGVSSGVLAKLFMKAEQVFGLNEFPKYLDYAA